MRVKKVNIQILATSEVIKNATVSLIILVENIGKISFTTILNLHMMLGVVKEIKLMKPELTGRRIQKANGEESGILRRLIMMVLKKYLIHINQRNILLVML